MQIYQAQDTSSEIAIATNLDLRSDLRARETGLLSLEALADSTIVYSVLKVTRRPRPRMEGG